jgi:hypothetical protein
MTTEYHTAPDLLLDKIAEVSAVLSKQKTDTESYRFWKSVFDVMKLSHSYITDTRFIHSRNEFLESENEFLKKWVKEYQERLRPYETIRAEILAGTLDQTVETVKKANDGN